ncbi:sensor histidine kinase [Cohnella sp. REN36]|uniref:sensor histidine kinase n=1 Tax=Cohnella sp. REN36 TaxID=2887347 RepID=UPI001D147603|nr:histidine kinase [Cohnella sp. REN36]MCC3374988.1 histidine kinase [Cohnella sp. REN36]
MRLVHHLTNHMKIRNKLYFSFIAVVLVPVLIVGVYLTVELRRMALDNAVDQTTANVERVKKRTSDLLKVAYDISYRLYNDHRLSELATRRYDSIYSVVKSYKSYPDFREYEDLYKEVSGIRLYFDNPTLLNNWEFLQPSPDVMGAFWYERAMKANGLIAWNYIRDDRNGQYNLSLIRRLDFTENNAKGILVININSAMLNGILSQETFETMIVDEYDHIVAANRPGQAGKTLADAHFGRDIADRSDGTFDTVVDGKKSRILIDTWNSADSLNGLRIISVFSVDGIVQEPNRIIRLAVVVISISILIALILIYGFSSLLTGRLLRLSKQFSRVASGKLDAALEIDGRDEIGQLSRQFNAMVGSIHELIMEVQDTNAQKNLLEKRQSEIRFRMMASQINPHFLFNTLESIRMKAVLHKEKEIARVVRLLGKLMRRSLEAGHSSVPLGSEIDVVKCYLEIQQFRYGERLNYELSIDPRAEDVPVPALIIQPLVENAIIHGLENKEEGVTVRIEARREGDGVRVSVTDDGAGMSAERLNEVKGHLEGPDEEGEGHRIGLRNVHLRMQLSYGPAYGLRIESEPGRGARVQFVIPHQQEGGLIHVRRAHRG